MEVLRSWISPLASRATSFLTKHAEHGDNQDDGFGCEWIEVSEPGGFVLRRMQRRRQLLQLDQVDLVLHYDHGRQCMRLEDVALVTAVEEVDDHGDFQWWMSVQDTRTIQVWILHFASRDRLEVWLGLLQRFVLLFNPHACVGHVILAHADYPGDIRSIKSPKVYETVLEINPANQ